MSIPACRKTGAIFFYYVPVYYENTDAGGVAYHADYLKFAERARTEYLRYMGLSQKTLQQEASILFVVHQMQITFHAPAFLDDVICVQTQLYKFSGVRFNFYQNLYRGKTLLVKGDISVACVSPQGNVCKVPTVIRQIIQRHL